MTAKIKANLWTIAGILVMLVLTLYLLWQVESIPNWIPLAIGGTVLFVITFAISAYWSYTHNNPSLQAERISSPAPQDPPSRRERLKEADKLLTLTASCRPLTHSQVPSAKNIVLVTNLQTYSITIQEQRTCLQNPQLPALQLPTSSAGPASPSFS